MITSIRLVNFKNFADETLRIGPFTVIVGANASGKSNIRDAFRFLHGIGRGYMLAEITGGKYGPSGQSEWACPASQRRFPYHMRRISPISFASVDTDTGKHQEWRPILEGELDKGRAIQSEAAGRHLPEAIRQAYSVIVTVNESNEIHAFKSAQRRRHIKAATRADRRGRVNSQVKRSRAQ